VKTTIPDSEAVLDDVDRSALAAMIEAAADVSLVVDAGGDIVDVVCGSEDLRAELDGQWLGRAWADTVTEDGRERVQDLLKVAGAPAGTRVVRDLTHRLADGSELPVRYCAVSLEEDGRVAAVGRDMRAVAALQQQVLNAQLTLEQDYWRLRQVETRYRLLFQMAGDPLLIVDPASQKVLEANPAADKLLSEGGKSIIGKTFPIGFDAAGSETLRGLMAEAGAVGRGSVAGVRSADGTRTFAVSANLLRQDNEARLLLRLSGVSEDAGGEAGEASARLSELLRRAPDAVVLTDLDGYISAANQTFLDLAELASEEQAIGRSIDRWLGRTGVDLNVLLTNLRQRDAVKLFATTLRGEYGSRTDVEISAAMYSQQDSAAFAFFIRDIGRRLVAEHAMSVRLPKTVEQITQQVGRVPLKELVRQSTDLIEKLCIEAALELTGDNRASAAELLGVSRQGLYAKLHRYKLGDKGAEE
jgi:transcriptional regulator PpsR